MNSQTIRKFCQSVALALKDKQLVNSFDYGRIQDINALSERPYPCLFLEQDINFTDTGFTSSRWLRTYKFVLLLVAQPSVQQSATEFKEHIAQLKSQLEYVTALVESAWFEFGLANKNKFSIGQTVNALPLDNMYNDQIYGYRLEFELTTYLDPNSCAFVNATGVNPKDLLCNFNS